MPPTREAAALTDAFRRRLVVLRDGSARLVTRRWTDLDLDGDIAATFEGWVDEATTVVTLAQSEAVRITDAYMSAYLRAAGIEPAGEPVDPETIVGRDLDGQPVERSLDAARVATLWMLARGQGRARALSYGLDTALRVSRSSVMAASREASAARTETEPRVSSWRRVAGTAACGACLALHGRESRSSEFPAHDRCRCTAEPVLRGVPERFPRPTGQQLFDRMSEAERIRRFGEAKAAVAAREGLDALVATKGRRIYEASERQIA